ncbi:unnamed protein product, partial [Rotaria sp. Silwood2]
KSPIEKLNDGSCNHIRCAICTCEFCWLCMKEVDNLHFITPTGCTFYGKKRWSKLKSILFLLLSWILTPILAILIIVVAIPILLIALPIIITKRFYQYTFELDMGSIRRFFLCTFVFISTFILPPLDNNPTHGILPAEEYTPAKLHSLFSENTYRAFDIGRNVGKPYKEDKHAREVKEAREMPIPQGMPPSESACTIA